MATGRERGIRSAFQIVFIIALALLLVGILSFEFSRTAAEVRRAAAEVTTLTQRVSAMGYVFRDEVVVESVDNGAVAYAAAGGTVVTRGEALALVYADGSNTGTRARAAAITAEIERLEALDAEEIPDYYGSYEALMSSLSLGSVIDTAGAAEELHAALERYFAQGQAASERAARIKDLQAEFDALVENDRNATDRIQAPCDGVFYRTVDGYEAVLSTSAIPTLTPGGLRALLASPQSTALAVGKIYAGGDWYLAVPFDAEEAASFQAGENYDIDVLRTGEHMTLTLARITAADTAGEVLLIFRAEGIAPPRDLARCEELTITTHEISGIWVPMAALREQNGAYTVFVEENGVAVTRKIAPVFIENGYCLAAQDASGEYLQEGERILVTRRRIYEGKVLK